MLTKEQMTDELYIALSHSGIDPDSEDFLAHYGVKGMKWGQRKRELSKPNPNYSADQRKRDKQVYGRGGVRRVNKNLNKGDSISTARGSEKTRRDRVLGRNKYVRQGGKVVGAIGGVVLANVGISALASAVGKATHKTRYGKGLNWVNVALTSDGMKQFSRAINTPQVRLMASGGAAYVANMMAGDIAVSINTRAAGYDPSRK